MLITLIKNWNSLNFKLKKFKLKIQHAFMQGLNSGQTLCQSQVGSIFLK